MSPEKQLRDEYGLFDSLILLLCKSLENIANGKMADKFSPMEKTMDEQKETFLASLKKIRRKVNWSKYILVDEAQDCQVNEEGPIT